LEELETILLAKVIAGDRSAFAEMVAPATPRLMATAIRMLGSRSEAEDALQDSLASLWVTRHRLDPNRPIEPMLTTIVLNKCRDRMRQRKAAFFIRFAAEPVTETVSADTPSPETQTADRETLTKTRQAISALPVKLKEALVLVAIDGRSQSEAATLLNASEKAIETRIYRARKILKEKLQLE